MDDVTFGYVYEFGAGEEFVATRDGASSWTASPIQAPQGDGLELVALEASKPERVMKAAEVAPGPGLPHPRSRIDRGGPLLRRLRALRRDDHHPELPLGRCGRRAADRESRGRHARVRGRGSRGRAARPERSVRRCRRADGRRPQPCSARRRRPSMPEGLGRLEHGRARCPRSLGHGPALGRQRGGAPLGVRPRRRSRSPLHGPEAEGRCPAGGAGRPRGVGGGEPGDLPGALRRGSRPTWRTG